MAGFSGLNPSGSGGGGRLLEVTVSDPVKHNEGINSYIQYKINTHTDRPEFVLGHTSVIRRYSDFVWLHNKLVANCPGALVPPLPEKSLVGRFESSFVETRRRALEKFLVRLTQHPELAANKSLGTFLQADDGALHTAKEEAKRAALPQPKKIMDFFNTSFNQVQHSLSQAGQNVPFPRTQSDETFDDIATYVNMLETQISNVAKETGNLIKRERETTDSLFQFGLALTLLGQNEVGGLGETLRCLGHTSDQLSVISASQVEQEFLHFEEPITEYSRLVSAVKEALHKRTQARVAYHHALMEVEHRNAQKQKLTQQGKTDKAQLAEGVASKAQQSADDAKQEFDLVSERFLRDFDRFKKEKAEDLKKIQIDYVTLKIDYHKKMQEGWVELLPKLEGLDVNEGGNSSSANSNHHGAKGPTKPSKPHFEERENGMEESTLIGV